MSQCLNCDGFGDIWDEDGTDSQTCSWCYGSGEVDYEVSEAIKKAAFSIRPPLFLKE